MGACRYGWRVIGSVAVTNTGEDGIHAKWLENWEERHCEDTISGSQEWKSDKAHTRSMRASAYNVSRLYLSYSTTKVNRFRAEIKIKNFKCKNDT